MTYNAQNYQEQGGERWVIGGDLMILPGGTVHLGAVDMTTQLSNALAGTAAGLKIAAGQHETVTASDTVVTGLATVLAVVVSLDDDPVADPGFVSATIGDQAGAPAAGSVIIKSWQTPGAPAPATTFGKKVNWIAFGT